MFDVNEKNAGQHEILVVDDTPANLQLVTQILAEHGYRVRPASGGLLALRSVAAKLPDLILLDVKMPDMDGFEVCRRLKSDERSRDVPVLFISALGDASDKTKGFEVGGQDYITKPFDPADVLARVAIHLRLHDLTERLEQKVDERTKNLTDVNLRLQQEIAERAKLEGELHETARRKDDFLALLGHELRNPLAPIRNAVQILHISGAMKPQAEQAVEIIDRQARHLTHIVDDLLDTTRIAHGKVTLHKEKVDWARLVYTTVEDIRSEADSRGIAVGLELPPQPVWVHGDPTRLTQILTNLLHNALKFTDAKGRIDLSLKVCAEDNTARLSLRDSGIGMSSETLRQIFEPFVQAETGLARSRGGLGLGLALAKGLLELHGGSIQAASGGLSQGSEFTICLPLTSAPPSDSARQPPGAATRLPLLILIIEDNLDAAESLQMYLTLVGHNAHTAADGANGLEKARQMRPDVILCDIGLPGKLNGYAVAREIRSDAVLRDAHLIAMTGYGQEEDKRRAREAGFEDHITKPADPAALKRMLESLPAVPA
jgi:signal transduction histidine kinase